MSDFNNIKELAQVYLQDADLEPLEKAYKFAEKIHADQMHRDFHRPTCVPRGNFVDQEWAANALSEFLECFVAND